MSVRLVPVCVAFVVVAGCGGGGGDPEPMDGVLEAGGVAGVRYATSTLSGTTDAAGGFRCTPGSPVYFYVGGTSLGSSACAARISLFTLAGTTAPTTERTLRRELDKARRMSTPFTTAMNLDRLLLALDADRNPANGLDVRERSAQLDGVALDVSLSRDAFEAALYRHVPQATRNLAPDRLVAHLYQSIGVRVSVHAPVEIRTDTNQGFFPTTHFFDFAPQGTLSYEGTDQTGDGLADSHYHYDIDPNGRLLDWRGESDFDFDGSTDRIFVLHRDYNSLGDLTGGSESYDDDADGDIDRRSEYEIAYDARGFRSGDSGRTDADGDGVFESTYETTLAYGSDGQVSSLTSESDFDSDGEPDATYVTTFRWAAMNRPQSETRESDDDADGVVDSRTVLTYEYLAGGVTRLVVETFDGASVTPNSRVVEITTADARGNPLSRTLEDDHFADGTIDQSMTSIVTYDADSRELTRRDDQDYDGNGIFDSRNTHRNVYDDAGNRIESFNEFFQFGGTQVLARYSSGMEVGAGGQPLITVGHFDSNADGFTDIRSEEVPTYREVADGARLLAQWYFQRSN